MGRTKRLDGAAGLGQRQGVEVMTTSCAGFDDERRIRANCRKAPEIRRIRNAPSQLAASREFLDAAVFLFGRRVMCESCAGDLGRGGKCNACGCSLECPGYQHPDPAWCMSASEEVASRRERGWVIGNELRQQEAREHGAVV